MTAISQIVVEFFCRR